MYIPLNLKVEFENLTVDYEKVKCRKAKTGMLHKSKLNAECKKIESRVQTSMTNTKCKIDCAKYNVKWNIEFWQKWNAQNSPVTELSRLS